MGKHSMTQAAPSTVPSVAAVKPAERLRAEQFGKGKHVRITPATVGSGPLGVNKPLSTGRHASGIQNSKGKNLGAYAGSHAGAEKPVAAPKHAAGAPASDTKFKDKMALRAVEAGNGYAPKHAAGEQGTGMHAKGNATKTQMAPNEAMNDAAANMPKSKTPVKKAGVKSEAGGMQGQQHFNHPALGPASNEGGNAKLLKTMTGAK
jgi:hypothetical protein